MRTFPFGLSYLISPGKSESPGVTLDLLAAARRSASQPMKARASIVTMMAKSISLSCRLAIASAVDDQSGQSIELTEQIERARVF